MKITKTNNNYKITDLTLYEEIKMSVILIYHRIKNWWNGTPIKVTRESLDVDSET